MFYIPLPIKFPFCVLKRSQEDWQKEHTKSRRKPLQSWFSNANVSQDQVAWCVHKFIQFYVCVHPYLYMKMDVTHLHWPFPYKYEYTQHWQSLISSKSDRRSPSHKYGFCTGFSCMTWNLWKEDGGLDAIPLETFCLDLFFFFEI